MSNLLAGQRRRLLAGVAVAALLAGSLVWAGATPGDPIESEYPDETEVTPAPEAYVGDRVVLGGFVVETEPVVIATRASGYGQFTLVGAVDNLQNADGPLERGDDVTAFGTLEDESTLAVDRATTRDSAETRYMYAVSLIGGLWVAGRFLRDWRFDRAALAFVPRDDPLTLQRLLGGGRSNRPARSSGDRTADRSRDADAGAPSNDDEGPPLKRAGLRSGADGEHATPAADGGERRG